MEEQMEDSPKKPSESPQRSESPEKENESP